MCQQLIMKSINKVKKCLFKICQLFKNGKDNKLCIFKFTTKFVYSDYLAL